MNISAPFIHRPVATTLLMAGLLLCGLVAYHLLPVAALPNVNFPTIQVMAQLPGADPETMASSVAQPLELTPTATRKCGLQGIAARDNQIALSIRAPDDWLAGAAGSDSE